MKDEAWKLADFGLTSESIHTIPHTTEARGTPGYRAPELLEPDGNEVYIRYDASVDIWALGCILHELVTGKKLFSNDWAVLDYRRSNNVNSAITEDMPVYSLFQQTIILDPPSRPTSAVILQDSLRNLENASSLLTNNEAPAAPSAVQIEPLSIPEHEVEARHLEVLMSTETLKILDAIICPAHSFVLIRSWNVNTRQGYKMQLWRVGRKAPLWEKVSSDPVSPTFSPNGNYIVTYSDGTLEVVQVENLMAVEFKPLCTTAISAVAVNHTGNGIAYTYARHPLSSFSEGFNLEQTPGKEISTAVISTEKISDISITYDSHGEYLFAVGRSDRMGLCGAVWDLRKEVYIRSLKFSGGEFRTSPLQSLFLYKPFVAVQASHPKNDVPTCLYIYTQKGAEAFKFGSECMLYATSLRLIFIFTMGDLWYIDFDDRYKSPAEWPVDDDEYDLEEQWFNVDSSVSTIKNHWRMFFIWSWDGSERKAKCLGYLNSENRRGGLTMMRLWHSRCKMIPLP